MGIKAQSLLQTLIFLSIVTSIIVIPTYFNSLSKKKGQWVLDNNDFKTTHEKDIVTTLEDLIQRVAELENDASR